MRRLLVPMPPEVLDLMPEGVGLVVWLRHGGHAPVLSRSLSKTLTICKASENVSPASHSRFLYGYRCNCPRAATGSLRCLANG